MLREIVAHARELVGGAIVVAGAAVGRFAVRVGGRVMGVPPGDGRPAVNEDGVPETRPSARDRIVGAMRAPAAVEIGEVARGLTARPPVRPALPDERPPPLRGSLAERRARGDLP